MRKKEKQPRLILWEKYKREHHLEEQSCNDDMKKNLLRKKAASFLLLLILVQMSILSVVGAIALWNPATRGILLGLV